MDMDTGTLVPGTIHRVPYNGYIPGTVQRVATELHPCTQHANPPAVCSSVRFHDHGTFSLLIILQVKLRDFACRRASIILKVKLVSPFSLFETQEYGGSRTQNSGILDFTLI